MRALVLVVAVLGCRAHETAPHTGSAASTGSAAGSAAAVGSAVAAGSAAAGSAAGGEVESFGPAIPAVKLDKPGGDPRHPITYRTRARGRTAQLTFTIGMQDAPPGAGTAMTLLLACHIPANAADPYDLKVTSSKAAIPDDSKGGERGVIGAVGGMYSNVTARIVGDANGRGRVIRTSDTLPTRPSIIWLLHPLIVPVPAEPVGLGATWHVTQALRMDDLEGQVMRTYQLTSVQDDTFTVEVTGTTRWTDRTGSNAEQVDETIKGTLLVDTSDLLPASADVTVTEDLGVARAATHLRLGP